MSNQTVVRPPNGNNAQPCVGCGRMLSFEQPSFDVTRTDKYTSAVAVHEQLTKCDGCGQSYKFVLRQLAYNFVSKPISEPERRELEKSEIIRLH